MEVFVTAINKLIIIFLLVLIGCFAKKKDIMYDYAHLGDVGRFWYRKVVPCAPYEPWYLGVQLYVCKYRLHGSSCNFHDLWGK